jgi:riboflavin kinase/FMN adenylyltransferase
MRVVSRLADVTTREGAVLTIGFFDGVHRGHQQLAQRTAELARRQRARAVAVTFWPHPMAILQPEEPLSLLTTLEEKLALLEALDTLDLVVVIPFTPDLALQSPEAFLGSLRDRFDIRAMVEGPDFRFAHERQGTLDWLRHVGEAGGFSVESLEVRSGGERISSTRIRRLIADGQVEAAAELLGASYRLVGTVVQGDQRGRLLGFPTANLRVDPVKLVPGHGVYAVRAMVAGEAPATRRAVANVGVRPTFGEGRTPLVEVHVLDATLDLYGQPLRTEWIARLREERRFEGLEALKAQIGADAAQVRNMLTEGGGATEDGRQDANAQTSTEVHPYIPT